MSGHGVADALGESFRRVTTIELTRDIDRALREWQPDVVFPVLHGPLGEDGAFQGLLEVLGYAYVGSGVTASACAMDKVIAKHLFRVAGVPVAPDVVIERSEDQAAAAARALRAIGSAVVVKPSRQGSAIGVGFAASQDELAQRLGEAFRSTTGSWWSDWRSVARSRWRSSKMRRRRAHCP